jgi:polygalacturonase
MKTINLFFKHSLLIIWICASGYELPGQKADGIYNILDFGAVSDTAVLCTEAINNAVEQCHSNGGGRVVIPPGDFKSGTVVLKDNVELYLSRGSTIFASKAHRDFPRQPQPEYRSQKDPAGWYALIYAEGASNISVAGKGTINGQGANQLPRPGTPRGDRDGRPRNVLFISCDNVQVEDLNMINSGMWNMHFLNCEDVGINGIRIHNHSNLNNDGIDIDGCRRVVLSNTIIDADDDAIVLKSTGAAACENITITNCIVSSHASGIKFGTESTGGFRNVTITNCIIKPSAVTELPPNRKYPKGSAGLALEIVDGGLMEGVAVNNIVMEGVQCPIFVRLGNRARKHTKNAPEPGTGTIRDVRISHITAYDAGNFSSSVTGIPEAKIENIHIDNIRIVNQGGVTRGDYLEKVEDVDESEKAYPSPARWEELPSSGLFIRHVKHITLSGISFESERTDPRPAIVASDVDFLKINDLYTDKEENNRFLLEDVNQFIMNQQSPEH